MLKFSLCFSVLNFCMGFSVLNLLYVFNHCVNVIKTVPSSFSNIVILYLHVTVERQQQS